MGRIVHGGQVRPHGSTMSRFVGTSSHGDRAAAALSADHPALQAGRTLFPSAVETAEASPRVLVSGHNSAKTGAKVTKGPWRGLPIYTLTLEERATCPRSCGQWDTCYGNAMPFARRHAHGPALIRALAREIDGKAEAHPEGFVIRLHVLGDFWSRDYARQWATWLHCYPGLHVWGYTAHRRSGEIGWAVADLNREFAGRCAIRFSEPAEGPVREMQAGTIWQTDGAWQAAEGIVCPAQTGATQACGTCGLCWSPAAAAKRILFLGHGKNVRGAASAGAAGGAAGGRTPPTVAWTADLESQARALRDAGVAWDDIGRQLFQRSNFGHAVRDRVERTFGPRAFAPTVVVETVQADMTLVEEWGQRHAPGLALCRTPVERLHHVNTQRRKFGLPLFRLGTVFGAGERLAPIGAAV